MAIYLDFSGSMFAAIHVDLKNGTEPNKEYLRHLVINTIRFYNKMFSSEYGLMHICLDSSSWRDDVFPEYKFERRKGREGDDNEWEIIFKYIYEIQEEVREHLPFPVIQAYSAEADDIIGSLIKSNKEPSMIVSNDKDFGALLKHQHVEIYRPIVKGKEKHPITDPDYFEFELIVSGDKADGIPSVRCPDNFYVTQHKARAADKAVDRAPPVTVKLKKAWYEAKQVSEDELKKVMGDIVYNNYLRNRQLISLECIPESVDYGIRKALKQATPAKIMKTLSFLTINRMNRLVPEIKDFVPNFTPRKVTSVFDL